MKDQKKAGLVPYDPRYYFPAFLAANLLLAYSPIPFEAKVWVGIVLVLLPLALGAWTSRPAGPSEVPLGAKDDFFKPAPVLWLAVLGAGICLRLCGYAALPAWPMWDDGLNCQLSILQMEHWSWQLAFSMEKVPPLFYWIQALYFKFVTPSLDAVWLLPALGSLLVLPLGYWACRQFFSRTATFFCVLLLAVGFWPLFLKVFYLGQGVVIWEIAALGFFGRYLRSLGTVSQTGRAAQLGLCLAVGLYTYITALPAILVLGLAFLGTTLRGKDKGWKAVLSFALAAGLLAAPVLVGMLENLSAGHAHQYSIFSHRAPLAEQLAVSLSHATAFLWGTIDKSYFNFGPLWGGYLNPVLASFFFLGLIELFRYRGRPLFYWGTGTLLLCLLPGLLSNTVEVMRGVTLFPFVMVLVTLGLVKLAKALPGSGRPILLSLLLAASFSLDLYHLWGPFHRWSVPDKYSAGSKSPEHFRAFQVLERWHEQKGPGLVMSDLYYDVFDQSLFVTTYGFNPAINPAMDPAQAKWAAVFMAVWDKPFFQKRFPQAELYDLSKGLPQGDGKMWMALLPVTEGNRGTLVPWALAHRQIQRLFPLYPIHVEKPSYGPVLGPLWRIYAEVRGDDFLQKCVMEKIVDAAYQSYDLSQAVPLLKLPMKELWAPEGFGPRYSLVFHRLGVFFARASRKEEARQCFWRAAHFDPNYPLRQALAALSAK